MCDAAQYFIEKWEGNIHFSCSGCVVPYDLATQYSYEHIAYYFQQLQAAERKKTLEIIATNDKLEADISLMTTQVAYLWKRAEEKGIVLDANK